MDSTFTGREGNPADRVEWVMMQVPDGTDWIEYMLYLPAEPSRAQLGSANHLAPGVVSVVELQKQLEKRGWKPAPGKNPQVLGVDGKMQLDLNDPDGTRVEFMEFLPVGTPCCSPIRKQPSASSSVVAHYLRVGRAHDSFVGGEKTGRLTERCLEPHVVAGAGSAP